MTQHALGTRISLVKGDAQKWFPWMRTTNILMVNTLVLGKCSSSFKSVIFEINFCGLISFYECFMTALDYMSMLARVMAWCRQAASHYLNPCWPISSVAKPHWMKSKFEQCVILLMRSFKSNMVQVKVCPLFVAKPLYFENVITFSPVLDMLTIKNRLNFKWKSNKIRTFLSRKGIWKCSLQNDISFIARKC